MHERALDPLGAVQLLGGSSRLGPDVAGAVHPRLSRDAQLGVAVDPFRVVRGENVGLDAERREILGELERALDPAASSGRKVHRHEEHLHATRW